MKTDDAILFFGTKAEIARQLNISKSAVSIWGDKPPLDRQFQLEVLTDGKLKADRSFAEGK